MRRPGSRTNALRIAALRDLWAMRMREVRAAYGNAVGGPSGTWSPSHWARLARVAHGADRLGGRLVERAELPPAHLVPLEVAAMHESLFAVGDPIVRKLRSADEAIRRLSAFGLAFDRDDHDLVHEGVMATLHGERVDGRVMSALGNGELMGPRGGEHHSVQTVMADAPHVSFGEPGELYDGVLDFISWAIAKLPPNLRPTWEGELSQVAFDLGAFRRFIEQRKANVVGHEFQQPLPQELEQQRQRNAAAWDVLRRRVDHAWADMPTGEVVRQALETARSFGETNFMVELPWPPENEPRQREAPCAERRPRLTVVRSEEWPAPATDLVFDDSSSESFDTLRVLDEASDPTPTTPKGPSGPSDPGNAR